MQERGKKLQQATTIEKENVIFAIAFAIHAISLATSLACPLDGGGDAIGHLYKIERLAEGYYFWLPQWYGGYPFLRFYPPAVYALGAVIYKILRSLAGTYVVLVLIAEVLLFLSFKELFKDLRSAAACYLAFSSSTFWYRVIRPGGELCMLLASSLLPLAFLAGKNIVKKRCSIAATSLILAAIALMHHATAVVALAAALIGMLYSNREVGWRTVVTRVAAVGVLCLGITAFWTVPAILEKKYFSTAKIGEDEALLRISTLSIIELLILPLPPFWRAGFFGPLIALSGEFIIPSVIIGAFLILPRYIRSLAMLVPIPPYKACSLLLLVSIVGIANNKRLKEKNVPILLAYAIMSSVMYTSAAVYLFKENGSFCSVSYPSWLEGVRCSGRAFVISSGHLGSWEGYVPDIVGTDTLNGWYWQANLIRREISKIVEYYNKTGRIPKIVKCYYVGCIIDGSSRRIYYMHPEVCTLSLENTNCTFLRIGKYSYRIICNKIYDTLLVPVPYYDHIAISGASIFWKDNRTGLIAVVPLGNIIELYVRPPVWYGYLYIVSAASAALTAMWLCKERSRA